MRRKSPRGLGGVRCAACHNSPHAWWPSSEAEDNLQAVALQGHPGYINQCQVCHTSTRTGSAHSGD